MQYLRARYYDTNTGRFASTDPFPGLNESPISKHRYLYANDNPITYSDPSGLFSMGEITAADILLTTLIGGLVQSYVGLAVTQLRGEEPVQWDGYPVNLSGPFADGLTASGFVFDLTSEVINGSRTRGIWLVTSIGTAFGTEPPSISVSVGLPSPDGSSATSVLSPRLFGTNPWALSGFFNYVAVDSSYYATVSHGYYSMGFGTGNISWMWGWGLIKGFNFSTFTGISIPVWSRSKKAV